MAKSQSQELTKTNSAALSTVGDIDDLIADAGRGTENIASNDIRPPRLVLCQSGTPERKMDNPRQIQGLQELDLFNSLSGAIYGRSVRFAVIESLGSHWIEFDDELNVVERDIPEGDPRTLWTTGPEGERVKPVATKFHDYLVYLVDTGEVLAFSMKSTQIKNAIKLNSLMKLPLNVNGRLIANPPAWARVYKIETKMESDKGYSWGGFNLSTDGVTPADTRALIREMAASYSKMNVVIEHAEELAAEQQDPTEGGAGVGSDDEM